jgi:hypothetical protein
MMKPTPAAIAAFDDAFPDDVRAERKKMFGMPAGFINGNMFIGVFADGVVLRMPAGRREELMQMEGTGPFEPRPGSPWKEYILAAAPQWGGTETLGRLAEEALAHTATMPAKVPKPRKKKLTRGA